MLLNTGQIRLMLLIIAQYEEFLQDFGDKLSDAEQTLKNSLQCYLPQEQLQ